MSSLLYSYGSLTRCLIQGCSTVYLEGIDHFINTPRDIVRLINILSVIYPSVRGEVNNVDLIALETLRVFCPDVYDTIRRNPDEFTGYSARDGRDIKAFHDSWLNQLQENDKEPIKRMLIRVFPKLAGVWGNTSYGPDWASSWRKELRLCSPEKFPVYFRLAIPEGEFSNAEMKTIISSIRDPKVFTEKLIGFSQQLRPDGTTKLRALLDQLEDYTERDIPSEYIPSLVQTLFEVGDKLLSPEDEPRGMFDFGNDIKIGRILWQVLRRLDEPSRFELLREAMTNGNAISIIESEIVTFGQQHGKYGSSQSKPEQERIVNAEHLEQLESIGLERIRQAAKADTLLLAPKLPYILYRWRDWCGEKEPRDWIQTVIKDDNSLLFILRRFLRKAFGQAFGDSVGRTEYRLNPKSLEPFLDPNSIVGRVKGLANKDGLGEAERVAINQFVKEYESIARGENPSEW